MSKKKKTKKRKTTKKKKQYPPELEAAWYVIKEFVNTLFCSYKYDGGVYPFNKIEVLDHHFSKTGVFGIYRYSKKKYALHLQQSQDHYFRSNHNAIHTTGYERSDEIAQNSILFKTLGISTKRQEHDGYYVILVMIDIDGHHGEADCKEVAQWLNANYFHQSYWEPSTSFSGQHGYIKIAIPIGTPLQEVHDTLNTLFELLDIKRILTGYQSPVDMPCGLPPIVTWDNTIEAPKNLPTVSYQEYRSFCTLRNYLKELKKNKQEDLINKQYLQISENHHYNDILKIVETPLPASVKSSQCGKLPRFNRTDPDLPTLDDIKFFYNLEYYEFTFFSELLHTLENDPEVLSYTPPETIPDPTPVEDIYPEPSVDDIPVPRKYDSDGIINSSSPSYSAGSSDTPVSPDSPMAPSEPGKGHSISFPSQEKNVVVLSEEEREENDIRISNDIRIAEDFFRNHCIGQLGNKPNNKDFEGYKSLKNNEKEENECISNDANERTIKYVLAYLRDYYREYNTKPKSEDVADDICKGYRQKYGTGKEDKGDRKRIVSFIKKGIKNFKPEKLATVRYKQFMFIPYIKEVFDKKHYKDILEDTSASKYRPNNLLLDLFAGYCYTHLSKNKDLTLSTYDGFMKFCAKYGVIIKYGNKCLACRLLLEHYGWLKMIDPDYEAPHMGVSNDWKVMKIKGRAMAYRLTDKFPLYFEFKKSVGGKNADKVEAKGMANIQDWGSMGSTA